MSGNVASELRACGELTESGGLRGLTTFLYYLLPNFSDFNVSAWIALGRPVAARLVLLNTVYALCYDGLLVAAAALIFSRKDLK